jgi:hypothetical protein
VKNINFILTLLSALTVTVVSSLKNEAARFDTDSSIGTFIYFFFYLSSGDQEAKKVWAGRS